MQLRPAARDLLDDLEELIIFTTESALGSGTTSAFEGANSRTERPAWGAFVDRRRDVLVHYVDAPTDAVVLTVVEKASSRLSTALSLGCR